MTSYLVYFCAFIPMIILGVIGVLMALWGNFFGIIPIILAIMVSPRIKELQESPRTVGLLSILSVKTEIQVEGIVVLLKIIGIRLIDVVEFSMKKEDLDYDIPQITAFGGGILQGKVELGITPNPVNGKYLKKYDDSGRQIGIKALTEGIVISCLQEICTENKFTADDCVTKTATLNYKLRQRLIGLDINGRRDKDSTDDITEFGIIIVTCVVKLQKDKSVVQADQNRLKTAIMNDRIKARREFYNERLKEEKGKNPTLEVPSLPSDQEIRAELLEEDRNSEGNIKEVRGGGTNVTLSDFDKDKGKK